MSRLTDSYHKLGLKQGASLEEVKKAHRKLVKKWHPDTFRSESGQTKAHHKISEINAAYTYLSALKNRSRRYGSTNSFRSSPRAQDQTKTNKKSDSNYHSYSSSQRTSHFHSTYRSNSEKQTPNDGSTQTRNKHRSTDAKKAHADLEFSWLNRFQQKLMSRIHQRTLRKKRRKFSSENLKKLLKEQKNWKKLKKQYEERTRIGMYRSLINALLFGKIFSEDNSQQAKSTSLGSYSVSHKYETDLRHHLIQDNIFYATNKSWNVLLKFLFGALFMLEFIYLLANYFLYDLFSSPVSFVATEMGILSLFALVFLPDNLFQRYLLWRYRDLARSDIQRTFSNRSLPEPWLTIKRRLLLIKYFAAFALTALYHHFVFIPLVMG